MAIVIIRQDDKIESWIEALQARSQGIPIYNFREEHPRDEIKMAMVWKHPPGSLGNYPNLRCISSFGAGVDFIFDDPALPANVPVTRVVDPVLASDMSEYVLAHILGYLKHIPAYAREQAQRVWHPRDYQRIGDVTVGIMGLGALGTVLARDLKKMGFRVMGWATSGLKEIDIPVFAGQEGLPAFLRQSRILVCLLPLTNATRGILNRDLFRQLPEGAFVINVARGGHLQDEDLLEMLDSGHLGAAALDVFHQEPLPVNHPFWAHPRIFLSPHVASITNQASVIPQLLENYERLVKGLPLKNVVSRAKGY